MCYVSRRDAVPPGLWYSLVRFACLATLLTQFWKRSDVIREVSMRRAGRRHGVPCNVLIIRCYLIIAWISG